MAYWKLGREIHGKAGLQLHQWFYSHRRSGSFFRKKFQGPIPPCITNYPPVNIDYKQQSTRGISKSVSYLTFEHQILKCHSQLENGLQSSFNSSNLTADSRTCCRNSTEYCRSWSCYLLPLQTKTNGWEK